jgi:hypothetical protein
MSRPPIKLTLADGPKSPPRPGPTPGSLSRFVNQPVQPIPLSQFLQTSPAQVPAPAQVPLRLKPSAPLRLKPSAQVPPKLEGKSKVPGKGSVKVVVQPREPSWNEALSGFFDPNGQLRSAAQSGLNVSTELLQTAAKGLSSATATASASATAAFSPPIPGNRGAQERTKKEITNQVEQTLESGQQLHTRLEEGLDRLTKGIGDLASEAVSGAKELGKQLERAGRFAIEQVQPTKVGPTGNWDDNLPPAVEEPEPEKPVVPVDPIKLNAQRAAFQASATDDLRLPKIQQFENQRNLQSYLETSMNYHEDKAIQKVLRERDQKEEEQKQELRRQKEQEMVENGKQLLKEQTSLETIREMYDTLFNRSGLSTYAQEQLYIEPEVFRKLEKVQELRKNAEAFFVSANKKLEVLQPKLTQLEILQKQIEQNEQQRLQLIKEVQSVSEKPGSTADEIEEKEEMLKALQQANRELKERVKEWEKITSTIKQLNSTLETVPESVELSALIFRRILLCALGDPECQSLVSLIEQKLAKSKVKADFYGLGRTRRKRKGKKAKSRKSYR